MASVRGCAKVILRTNGALILSYVTKNFFVTRILIQDINHEDIYKLGLPTSNRSQVPTYNISEFSLFINLKSRYLQVIQKRLTLKI